jgi:hypothetical protein
MSRRGQHFSGLGIRGIAMQVVFELSVTKICGTP